MAKVPRVLVLLATYNAQEYLAELLDSVLGQEGVELRVRVSDDCSTDSTYRILETYATEHPNIELRYNLAHQGKTATIMGLVYDAPADDFDFIATVNQGDVWQPGHLAMGAAHITANTSRPELYYCGVEAVDEYGEPMGSGFEDFEVCAAHPASLLLVRNWAYGGAMVMNGALVKLLRQHRACDFARPYDAWIHAVALYCDGFVYGDLGHCYVETHVSPAASPANGAPALAGSVRESQEGGFSTDDAQGPSSEIFGYAGDFDPGFAQRCTAMAQALLREYERAMDEDTAKLVEAVAVRHDSAKARRHLAGRTDIVLPTSPRTSKLRWKILTGAF